MQEKSYNTEIPGSGFDKSLLPRALLKTWSQEPSRNIYELKKQRVRYRVRNARETEVRQGRETDREEGQREKQMSEGWPGDWSREIS